MKKQVERKFEQRAVALRAQADKIVIRSNEDCERAAAMLTKIKGFQQQWKEIIVPAEVKMREAYEAIRVAKRKVLAPFEYAEGVLKDRIAAWTEKLRAEEARAQVKAEAKAVTVADRERNKTVKVLAENGQKAEARVLARQPLIVPPVVAPVDRPVMPGVAITQRWGFRIVTAALLPREFLMPDERKIGERVRMMKGETRIPGVEVFAQTVVAAGVGEGA